MSFQHHLVLPDNVSLLDLQVHMSNILARSSQGLNLAEKRLIGACLAKMGKQGWPKTWNEYPAAVHAEHWDEWTDLPNSPFTVRVTAADYAEAAQVTMKTAYAQLAEASESLYERSIELDVKTAAGIKHRKFRWIQEKAEYQKGAGWVELTWTFMVAQHLYSLRNNFTKYRLGFVAPLDKLYSIRLAEQFASWADEEERDKGIFRGVYKPTIEEFHIAIGTPDAYLKDFAGVRRRIIDVAVGEIEEKLNLDVQWDTVMRGRKVTGLRFKFGPKTDQPQEDAEE